jgi:hypothetical protein
LRNSECLSQIFDTPLSDRGFIEVFRRQNNPLWQTKELSEKQGGVPYMAALGRSRVRARIGFGILTGATSGPRYAANDPPSYAGAAIA